MKRGTKQATKEKTMLQIIHKSTVDALRTPKETPSPKVETIKPLPSKADQRKDLEAQLHAFKILGGQIRRIG